MQDLLWEFGILGFAKAVERGLKSQRVSLPPRIQGWPTAVMCTALLACGETRPNTGTLHKAPAEDEVGPSLTSVHAYQGWLCEGYGGAAESSGNCWRELEVVRAGSSPLICGLYENCTEAGAPVHCEPGRGECCRDDIEYCKSSDTFKADAETFIVGDNQGLESFNITLDQFQAIERLVGSDEFRTSFALPEHEACIGGYTDSNLRYTVEWSDGTSAHYRTAGKCLFQPEHPFSKVMDQLSNLRIQFLPCDSLNESTMDFNEVRGACIPCDGGC